MDIKEFLPLEDELTPRRESDDLKHLQEIHQEVEQMQELHLELNHQKVNQMQEHHFELNQGWTFVWCKIR